MENIKNRTNKIMSWFDFRINNGLQDGTKSVIQLFKRRIRGFKKLFI